MNSTYFSWIMIALQIADAVQHFLHMKPSEEGDIPTLHFKSGTTTLDINIHVKQDAKK